MLGWIHTHKIHPMDWSENLSRESMGCSDFPPFFSGALPPLWSHLGRRWRCADNHTRSRAAQSSSRSGGSWGADLHGQVVELAPIQKVIELFRAFHRNWGVPPNKFARWLISWNIPWVETDESPWVARFFQVYERLGPTWTPGKSRGKKQHSEHPGNTPLDRLWGVAKNPKVAISIWKMIVI